MFDLIARVATSRPWRVLAITAVVFVLGGALGGPVAGLLNSDNDSFSDTGAESAQAIDRIEDASGLKAAPDLVVVLDTDDASGLRELRAVLADNDDVARVVGGPDQGPAFVSRDGSKTYVAAIYSADADPDATTEHLREHLDDVDGLVLGGNGVAYQQVNERVESGIVKAEIIAFPLLFIVSLLVFRSAVSALLPLMVGGLTIVTSLLAVRVINEQIEVSIFALNLITGLGLGLSIDYSLFLVSRFREELERLGDGPDVVRQAVVTTVQTAGRTVVYSAVTVAGAGLALLVFPLRFLYSMGIGVTVVSLVAALVALALLPALFFVLGRRVNAGGLKRWQASLAAEARAENTGFWYRLSKFVMRRPIPIALAGTAILLALGSPFLRIEFTGVDANVLPKADSARQVADTLRTEFDGADASPIIVAVESDSADAVTSYAGRLADLDGVAAVSEPVPFDGVWQIDVLAEKPALDEQTLDLVETIRDVDAPGDRWVGGQSAEQVDQVASIMANIPPALLILTLLTVITLFLMTGSVILPLKALVMNVLTISATFGILVLIFQDGHLEGPLGFTSQGALESSQPVFLFATVFGLSTDYAVFLLTRIKEARDHGASDREAVALGLQRTGRIVTAAALLFAIALGAFATSEIIFIKELGVGTALAVLIDATLVRALLVPSLMALLGRANWWAPAPLRRLHARIGLHEGERVPVG